MPLPSYPFYLRYNIFVYKYSYFYRKLYKIKKRHLIMSSRDINILKPLLIFAIYYFVFSFIVKINVQNYPIFLLLGITIWSFFAQGTSSGMNSLLKKGDIITKTYFKKEIIPISSAIDSSIDLLFTIFIFLIFSFIFGIYPGVYSLLFILIFIELFILVLGISFILSSLVLKYRDLIHIWEVLLLIGFWLSPIVYPISLVPKQILSIYMLNPITRIIIDSRDIFIYNTISSVGGAVLTLIICLGIFITGYIIFKKRSSNFAE